MIAYELDLNLRPSGVLPRLNVSQYDHGQTITCVLWDGNTPFTMPNGSAASVAGTKPDGTGFTYSCTYEAGQPVVTLTEQMSAVAGEVMCELVIIKSGERQGTINFVIDVEPAALRSDVPISETDIPIIEQIPEIQAEVEAAKQLAEMWAVGPDGSEEDEPSSTNNAYYWAMQAASYAGGGLKPEVVQSLPTQNISTSTLYFVPSSDPSTSNFYDEYINVDGTSQGWEKIGTTSTDLTAYQKITDNNLVTTDKTVVGAINELAGDISEINTDFTKYNFGTSVSIKDYTSASNAYTCPSDGYVRLSLANSTDMKGTVIVNGLMMLSFTRADDYPVTSLFVRKGMTVYCTNFSADAGIAFIPLT